MNFFAILTLALTALLRNLGRSLLTMLGIIIGVAAVIITVAIGVGAQNFVQQQITGLGSNLLMVLPGSITQGGVRSGSGGASTLTPADGMAIALLPAVAAVSPMVSLHSQVVSGARNWQTSIAGVAPSYTFIRNWPLAEGSFISQNDTNTIAKICILGQTVVSNLFSAGSSPLGKTVLITNVPFTVVGTLTAKGQSGLGQDQDDTVLIPYTSAMERLTGLKTVNVLMVSASTADQSTPLEASITKLMQQRHRSIPGAANDFTVRNLQDIAQTADATASALKALLAGVAGVSLIVGGIGIMNIMLVSVTERTREIGLRMALGARAQIILEQFLAESVVLSLLGGLIGVAVGMLGVLIMALITGWPVAVPLEAVVLAVAFSAIVGIFFGYYPAYKAAHLNPIDALHAE